MRRLNLEFPFDRPRDLKILVKIPEKERKGRSEVKEIIAEETGRLIFQNFLSRIVSPFEILFSRLELPEQRKRERETEKISNELHFGTIGRIGKIVRRDSLSRRVHEGRA